MPMFPKGYYIDSEEDIPEEYREEVKKVAQSNDETSYGDYVTLGKMGKSIDDHDSIAQVFENGNNLYLGHGTNVKGEILDTMIKNGIMVKTPKAARGYIATSRGLDSMTILLGYGSEELFDKCSTQLDNWPHKSAKKVVIVTVPSEYILDNGSIGIGGDPFEAFYTGSETDGYTLRPEFIKGVYDSESQSFTENENYYENLGPEDRDRLWGELKESYMGAYAKYSSYPPKEATSPLPLNEDEIETLSIKWYAVQLQRLRLDQERRFLKPDTDMMDISELTKSVDMFGFNGESQNIREEVQTSDKNKEDHSDDGDIEWVFDDDKW